MNAILDYFEGNKDVNFPLIVCNNKKAGALDIASKRGIDVLLVNKDIFTSDVFIDTLDFYNPDLIVLAGFLWKIPSFIVENYPNKIINIHPSLLPKYGGKGMYGHHVHEAVIANKEKESGFTIHLVNEEYDEGTVLLQKSLKVTAKDTAETLAANVLKLEHEWYSKVIENMLKS